MKSRFIYLFLGFTIGLCLFFCNPSDLRNSGDTRSEASLERLLWQEFIRPLAVCDTTQFEYEPAYRSVTVREALTPIQIIQTRDKSIYVFGISTFKPEKNLDADAFVGTEDSTTSRNAALFKFTANGALEWTRTIGLANTAGNAIGLIESDSGVYLAFTASSSVGSPLNNFISGFTNVAVFHMAKDGSILWNTYFGSSTGNNKAYSIAKLSNGDLVVGGETNSNGFSSFPGSVFKLSSTIPENASFVMRLKPTGTGTWVHFFAGSTSTQIRTVEKVSVSSTDTIYTYGFEREPLDVGYNLVVQNHTGTTPRKEFLIAQFDADGKYLRHTFLLSGSSQASPILPIPKESEIPNEMIFAGVTSAQFVGLDSVRVRNYQGSYDQFVIKLNSTLNASYVTYLGGPGADQGSIYKIFQDSRKAGYFVFSPFLFDPGYDTSFPGRAGYPTLGLIRLDSTGNLLEYGFKAETEFNVPLTYTDTCDGGSLIGYYVGDAIDFSVAKYAKFRLSKTRPQIPIYRTYQDPFGQYPGK